ncbi:transposase IS66-like protein [Palleronia aestuarii]|uniref:Transposase IS66-like protein n=1 Tax=Palleronia aestuarii TaxID=568105 RepID=A0A2W7MYL3_9RHOB|nr:transposase IS66-like protein [Palleronia aestuarii]
MASGQHQPLNRQAERYAREGVELSQSTLADQVGAAAAALAPLHARIEAHVMAATRLHGDDTTVPVLAKGRTRTGRLWVYVRDDRPFGGQTPPAALFRYSPDRRGEHPEAHLEAWSGILQADAYAGFGGLYAEGRNPAPVVSALCWAHARRKFYELADIAAGTRRGKAAPSISPLALEAVRRIDGIFDAERAINGASVDARLDAQRETIAPMVADLERWMRDERARLSRHAPVARAMDYMLRRWPGFATFLEDGRACLTNSEPVNATGSREQANAERALRGVALGRKAWLFAGSNRGGERAAFVYGMIATAKLNSVDPHAWLADVLAHIADMPASRLDDLLPWNWAATVTTAKAA